MTRSTVANAQNPPMARIAAAISGQAQIRLASDRPVHGLPPLRQAVSNTSRTRPTSRTSDTGSEPKSIGGPPCDQPGPKARPIVSITPGLRSTVASCVRGVV